MWVQIKFVFGACHRCLGIGIQIFVIDIEIEIFGNFDISADLCSPANAVVNLEIIDTINLGAERENDVHTYTNIGADQRTGKRMVFQGERRRKQPGRTGKTVIQFDVVAGNTSNQFRRKVFGNKVFKVKFRNNVITYFCV